MSASRGAAAGFATHLRSGSYPRTFEKSRIDDQMLGRSGGTRTPGIRFWRPTLYQLSYTPVPAKEGALAWHAGEGKQETLEENAALHDPPCATLHRHTIEGRVPCLRRHLFGIDDPWRVGIDEDEVCCGAA